MIESSLTQIDFVRDQSARYKYIVSKAKRSQENARITNLPSEDKTYSVVSLDPKYLVYNVDNARVRTFLQDVEEEYDPRKIDELINQKYQQMNNHDIQLLLHEYLFSEAQKKDYDIFNELQNGIQGDYLEIDCDGIVIDGNRRLSAIREVIETGDVQIKDKLKEIKCLVIMDETASSSRHRNKEIENLKNLSSNLQLKHHFIDQDSEIFRQFNELFDPEKDNASQVYQDIGKKYQLDGDTDRKKANDARMRIQRHKVTNQYLQFRKDNDEPTIKLNDLKDENIQFDMQNFTKFIDEQASDEKVAKFKFGFTFIAGHKHGSLPGSSYKYLAKWDDFYKAFQDVTRVKSSEKLIEKIDQVLKKDKDEWTKFTKKVIQKKKENDDKKDEDDRNKEVIDSLRKTASDLINIQIALDDTILASDIDNSKTTIETIENEVKRILKEINQLNAD